jgi:hypothetical protein
MVNKLTIITYSVLIIILFSVAATGCVKTAQNLLDKDTQSLPDEMTVSAPPGTPAGTMPADDAQVSMAIATITPQPTLGVNEIDPNPYITPDPYRLPYRNVDNLTSDPAIQRVWIPGFTKKVVLHSNSTAFHVDAPEGPLIIDLTFAPQYEKPDQTNDQGSSYPSDDEEEEEEEEDSGGEPLSGSYGFVYSQAEVTVIDSGTNATVAQEGYGGIYSSNKKKQIVIYRDGSFVVALKGDFIDVTLKIANGPGIIPVTSTPVPATGYEESEDEYW